MIEGLEIVCHQRGERWLMVCREEVEAVVDRGLEVGEVGVTTRSERRLLHKLPLTFDPVQVRRIGSQEQQLNANSLLKVTWSGSAVASLREPRACREKSGRSLAGVFERSRVCVSSGFSPTAIYRPPSVRRI